MPKIPSLKFQLKQEVLTLSTETLLVDVVRRMKKENIGAVILINNHNEPVGIFTERDLLKKIDLIIQHNAWQKPIGLFMSKPILTLPLDRLKEAAKIMVDHHIRHVPLTVDGRIAAIVSIRDLFQEFYKTLEENSEWNQTPLIKDDSKKVFYAWSRSKETLATLDQILSDFKRVPWSNIEEIPQPPKELDLKDAIIIVDTDNTTESELMAFYQQTGGLLESRHFAFVCSPLELDLSKKKLLTEIYRAHKSRVFSKPFRVADIRQLV